MPERIQLRRTKGYRKPKDAIVVARPSKWGNPYRVAQLGEVAVEMFERDLRAAIERPWSEPHTIEFRIMAAELYELTGRDLACWCDPTEVCHADVLLELANPIACIARGES